jgi:uncharacterized protein (TIGR00297 family)
LLCAVLSVLSYWFGLLTISGSVASFLVGIVIGGLGSIGWLLTLIAFTFMGFIVTKFRFQIKETKGLQEGKKGERTYRNVLANGLVPAAVAVISFLLGEQESTLASIAYISAIAVAAADTTASELGVLSDRTYLITTGKRVPPGTDGGVSILGTAWCIVASFAASYVGWLFAFQQFFDLLLLIPVVMGVTGCMMDSLIGATLERKRIVGKLQNNIMSMAFGGALAALVYVLL